jgi:hypothetical protein
MKIVFTALFALASSTLVPATAVGAGQPAAARDGQHDFDWEIGAWDTRLKRLREPLSGKTDWIEYAGTSVGMPVMGKRANLVELDVRGAAGAARIAGISLRLYAPASGEWTLHFANLSNGKMTDPMTGTFSTGLGTGAGTGHFYGQDSVDGRKVRVRFLIIPVNADQWRFEQAYSADGGNTWETNWIAIDTRRKAPNLHQPPAAGAGQ